MREKIKQLKKSINELESYMYNENKEKMHELTNEIIEISENIKQGLEYKQDAKYSNKDNNLSKYGLNHVGTLPFLYKPVTKKDYYEGDYLEVFSRQRSDELKRAEALEIHNKFWTVNSVERGNIFGSIPKELISEEASRLLLSYGWNISVVSVYEIDEEKDIDEVLNLCEDEIQNYLLVNEKKNNQMLILQYKI